MNSRIYVYISRLGIFMEMRVIVEIIKRDCAEISVTCYTLRRVHLILDILYTRYEHFMHFRAINPLIFHRRAILRCDTWSTNRALPRNCLFIDNGNTV